MQHFVDTSSSSAEELGTQADSDFLKDVLAGLGAKNKSLQCKYLYDERGSELFDRICELEEYYPTRTETQITVDNAQDIGACIGENVVVVEYGSGSSTKTRHLLDNLPNPVAYLPVDISETHLLGVAESLKKEYPTLSVHPIVADFTAAFEIPSVFTGERICVYFPGSTIGNLEPDDAVALLKTIYSQCGDGGGLLLGFDLQKATSVLELAYDDPQGVTAKFNLNLLHRINNELDGNLEVENFKHVARYNEDLARVEIYIESLCDQTSTIAGQEVTFAEGEHIHTEYSHKYTLESMSELCEHAGFTPRKIWTDERGYFALMHMVAD